MEQLDFETMQKIQQDMQEKYKDMWGGLPPEQARQKLLWMYGEMGEVWGCHKEMYDVLMYFNDILLCYGVKPEKLEKVYFEKHKRNMNRW